jgi:anhydro-N-acetylmuramic acid kinase
MKYYKVLGLMSGTSLDGLDLALCTFGYDKGNWNFAVEKSATCPYNKEWKKKLSLAGKLNAYDFISFHKEYGCFIGEKVNDFTHNDKGSVDFIASHGHTIFHEPDKQLTFQLGDGAMIAAVTGLTTISDFRNLDISLGGQGAPLVPIGDDFLFGNYDYCLNLGGFSNISYRMNNKRIAFDICPVNIILNRIAQKAGFDFDKDGEIGSRGKLLPELLNELDKLEYYNILPPKSLSREWLEKYFLPVLEKQSFLIEDILRTLYEHLAEQISKTVSGSSKNMLVTGGGAYNKFLVELLQNKTDVKIIVPDRQIVEYKEAIIFAFLGLLRYEKKVNCLSSVTGARLDNCGGSIFEGTYKRHHLKAMPVTKF